MPRCVRHQVRADPVIGQLASGAVEWCRLAPANSGALDPAQLEAFVRSEMRFVVDTPAGALYRSPAVSARADG